MNGLVIIAWDLLDIKNPFCKKIRPVSGYRIKNSLFPTINFENSLNLRSCKKDVFFVIMY